MKTITSAYVTNPKTDQFESMVIESTREACEKFLREFYGDDTEMTIQEIELDDFEPLDGWLRHTSMTREQLKSYLSEDVAWKTSSETKPTLKMKTITSAEIIAIHDTELDYAPYGYDETIREMLASESDQKWHIAGEENKEITYVAESVGDAGPVILTIYDAVEPGWETESVADESLRNMGILEILTAAWS